MSDVVVFVRARVDEDRQVAVDAAGRSADWVIEAETAPYAWGADPVDENVLAGGKPIARVDWEYGGILNAAHIARHDPARVLRDVEAKRRIVDAYVKTRDLAEGAGRVEMWAVVKALENVVGQFAAVWSDHPDYEPGWTK